METTAAATTTTATETAPVEATETTDTESSGEESIEKRAMADGQEKPAQPVKKKFKLKVYDKEQEYDEDEVVRLAQRASAADERFQTAAQLEKRYNSMVENLKKNPWELFKALNLDPDMAAEQRLIDKLKLETMTPEQRRAYDLEQENLRLKSERDMTKEELETERKNATEQIYNELRSEAVTTIDQGIVKAVQDAGLKKATPGLIRRVAQQMLAYHHTNGGKLQDPTAALKKVLGDMQSEWTEVLDTLPESEYETRLPQGFIEKLRKYLISRVDNPASFSKPKSQTTTARPSGKRVKMTTDQFFADMEKRFG